MNAKLLESLKVEGGFQEEVKKVLKKVKEAEGAVKSGEKAFTLQRGDQNKRLIQEAQDRLLKILKEQKEVGKAYQAQVNLVEGLEKCKEEVLAYKTAEVLEKRHKEVEKKRKP